jgi:hypothetical protein
MLGFEIPPFTYLVIILILVKFMNQRKASHVLDLYPATAVRIRI